jgi:hypothetical protein
MTSGSWLGLHRARFLLGGALLAAVTALAASCAEGIGAAGYEDAFVAACEQATRCYGDAYVDCAGRLDRMVKEGTQAEWLKKLRSLGCLDRCDALYRCLDHEPICEPVVKLQTATTVVLSECAIDDDCCDFSTGAAVCASGLCCRPIGAACSRGEECCANAGDCSEETGTCGGVTCERSGELCLNGFQCCTGRCGDDKRCEETPCPPEGFACATDADCCDMLCNPETKRCFRPPECSLQGEACVVAADCCNKEHVCFDGGNPGSGGVCSPAECTPNNVDCHESAQCCSGYCAPEPYRLCGQCAKKGESCGPAAPCCLDLVCGATGKCG